MPFMNALVERLNTRFNRANIGHVDRELLAPGKSVIEAAAASSRGASPIRATGSETDYLTRHVNAAELEGLREELYWAVSQQPRVPVQFLWIPVEGTDEVTVEWYRVDGIEGSGPAVSVLLRGPTPAKFKKGPGKSG